MTVCVFVCDVIFFSGTTYTVHFYEKEIRTKKAGVFCIHDFA